MKIHPIAIILSLITAFLVGADSKKGESEKTAWNRELQKLIREKPAEYAQTRAGFTFLAELVLAQLGYGTGPFDGVLDEKTQSALRRYEENRKLPVTGDPLSFETVEQLRADEEAYSYRPVYLPRLHVYTKLWDQGFVSASGTWVISGEKMGMPEQTSTIQCSRELGTCTEATAILTGIVDTRQLAVVIDTYEIERWDEHEIVTKPLQFGCTRYVRRFNRIQESVTGIRSTISNDEFCKGVDRTEKHLKLTDGFDVYWELHQAYSKKRRELMQISPELLKVLESQSKSRTK